MAVAQNVFVLRTLPNPSALSIMGSLRSFARKMPGVGVNPIIFLAGNVRQ